MTRRRAKSNGGGGCMGGLAVIAGIFLMIAFAPYVIAIGLGVFMIVGMIGVLADALTGNSQP